MHTSLQSSRAPATKKWFAFPKANPEARLRLFCLPYAGGGAHIYFPWQEKLSPSVEVCAVQLPGRGMRFGDKPFRHHKQIIQELVMAMRDYIDKPYAIFGHSMGALLAYELAQSIREHNLPQPGHLFVSGRRAMHIPTDKNAIYDLPESELIKELRDLNGTPTEVLENKELMQMVLPVIRADFELCDTYSHDKNHAKLDVNITAFEGDNDHKAQGEQVSAWKELTHGQFQTERFIGDHFFIHSNQQQLLKVLNQHLMQIHY